MILPIRGSERSPVTSSYGRRSPTACPSHKSPDQPCGMSPIYFTRWPRRPGPAPRPLSTVILSPYATRPTAAGYREPRARAYRCFIGIHYLSTATISPAEVRSAPEYRCSVFRAPGPRGQSGEKKGKKVIRHRNHVRLGRSNVQIPG